MGHGAHLDFGSGIGSMFLRIIVLGALPVVVGFVLLRGFLGEPSRRTTAWVIGAAAAVVGMELLLSGGLNLPEQVVPLLLAALALPMYLILSRDERFVRPVGLLRGLAPLVFVTLAVFAVLQLGAGWFAGAGPDRTATLLHTGVLLGVVALVWFAADRPRGRAATVVTRVSAALVAMALLGASAQAILLRPSDPVPGIATEAQLEIGPGFVDVVVVPNLPGRNLVHVGSATASVGTSEDDLERVHPSPDATSGWLDIELPAGRSDVWVKDAGQVDSVTTDTGGTGTAPDGLAGADGPECASALLGRMVVLGAVSEGVRCPSEQLDPADAETLRETVASLADDGHQRLAAVGDKSPRGLAATRTVTEASAELGIELVPPGDPEVPLLVTSGWSEAGKLLRRGDLSAAGTYLAPWLYTDAIAVGDHVEVGFDADDESFQRYRTELRTDYPNQPASAAGYEAWRSALSEWRRTDPST